jgi:hypothetical protein
VDRDAVARAGRRAQAEEALADEREREAALRQQVAEVVLEQEGCRVDAEAFAGLDADEVRRVRTALGQLDDETEDDDAWLAELSIELDDEAEREEPEQELSRLEDEIAESRRTQLALERYLAALDGAAATGEG